VATSGSRPRDVGAKANGSLGDANRTRLSKGMSNRELSSRFCTSETIDGGAKYESTRPWGDEGDEGDVDPRGGPWGESMLLSLVRRLEMTGESDLSDAPRREALTARRCGAFHRLILELPDAVHNKLSSNATILLMPSDEAVLRSPWSWHMTMHSPSDTSEQSSTSTLHTSPVLSPE
jgi:hypothetical protein